MAHEKTRTLQWTTVTHCVEPSLFSPCGNILWHGLSFDKAIQKAITTTLTFLGTISLSFHSIISLFISPLSTSVFYHLALTNIRFSNLFLPQSIYSSLRSPVPHSNVRHSTTQALFMQCVCSAGQSCSTITAMLASKQTLMRTTAHSCRDKKKEKMLNLRLEASASQSITLEFVSIWHTHGWQVHTLLRLRVCHSL